MVTTAVQDLVVWGVVVDQVNQQFVTCAASVAKELKLCFHVHKCFVVV